MPLRPCVHARHAYDAGVFPCVMKAEEFDRRFDVGEDTSKEVDWGNPRRPNADDGAGQWAGDPGMVESCKEAQRPKVRQFVTAKVTYETLRARDRTLFGSDVKRYRAWQAAYPGDFEMATDRPVSTLAARLSHEPRSDGL